MPSLINWQESVIYAIGACMHICVSPPKLFVTKSDPSHQSQPLVVSYLAISLLTLCQVSTNTKITGIVSFDYLLLSLVAIPPQQDYNWCESGPVAKEREMGTLRSCIIYIIEYFTFFFKQNPCNCRIHIKRINFENRNM